jgi:hypothetical protein
MSLAVEFNGWKMKTRTLGGRPSGCIRDGTKEVRSVPITSSKYWRTGSDDSDQTAPLTKGRETRSTGQNALRVNAIVAHAPPVGPS